MNIINLIVERFICTLNQMRPDARQKIVDKIEEELKKTYETGCKLKSIEKIIEEVVLDIPDHKLFDDEDDYPFVNVLGFQFCLN